MSWLEKLRHSRNLSHVYVSSGNSKARLRVQRSFAVSVNLGSNNSHRKSWAVITIEIFDLKSLKELVAKF